MKFRINNRIIEIDGEWKDIKLALIDFHDVIKQMVNIEKLIIDGEEY